MRSLSLAFIAVSLAGPTFGVPCNSVLGSVSKTVSWFAAFGEPAAEQFLSRTRDEYPDTIYRTLKGQQQFSTLVKIIDKLERIRDVLDSDKQLTFFAPTNEALEKHHYLDWEGEHGEKDKRRIMEDTLKYHMIPGVLEDRLFGQNSTIATNLRAGDGSFDEARRRIKVEKTTLPPRRVTLNNYVNVVQSDIHAKNGVIHAVDAPLYLPPDIMDIIYMIPTEMSISTTAFLKTNLQNNYEFNSGYKRKGDQKHIGHHNDRYGRGSPATTVFVPSNEAWNKLPKDLIFYLFSPAGERTLRKLMAWHTLPDQVVFTEWIRDVDHDHDKDKKKKKDGFADESDLGFEWDRHFRSFIDQRMPVHVKKIGSRLPLPGAGQYTVTLQAHGLHATVIDNPAQNGAFHVVPQVLSPRSVEGVGEAQNEKDWQEWREWLTDWSYEHEEADSN